MFGLRIRLLNHALNKAIHFAWMGDRNHVSSAGKRFVWLGSTHRHDDVFFTVNVKHGAGNFRRFAPIQNPG